NDARYYHTASAVSYASGSVFAAGGYGTSGPLATAELYNPSTATWTRTATNLSGARYGHTATVLQSGDVLVAGGYNTGYLASAELYQAAAGWSSAGSLSAPRYALLSARLANGAVVAMGGYYYSAPSWIYPTVGELYDPAQRR